MLLSQGRGLQQESLRQDGVPCNSLQANPRREHSAPVLPFFLLAEVQERVSVYQPWECDGW